DSGDLVRAGHGQPSYNRDSPSAVDSEDLVELAHSVAAAEHIRGVAEFDRGGIVTRTRKPPEQAAPVPADEADGVRRGVGGRETSGQEEARAETRRGGVLQRSGQLRRVRDGELDRLAALRRSRRSSRRRGRARRKMRTRAVALKKRPAHEREQGGQG